MIKSLQTIKELTGNENELVISVENALKERVSSPFYGYFIIAWVISNWKIIYVAVLIDQKILFEKYGLLRNEYLKIHVFPAGWEIFLHYLIYPSLAAIFFAYFFPYISKKFYKQDIKTKNSLRRIKLEEDGKLFNQEQKVLKIVQENIKTEQEIEKEKPEILWEKEYQKLKNNTILFKQFEQIINSLYNYNSLIKSSTGGRIIYQDILAYCDSNGILNIEDGRIKMTEKGKFFIKNYVENIGK